MTEHFSSNFDRLEALRKRLNEDNLSLEDFAQPEIFRLSDTGRAFLRDVSNYNLKYCRGGKGGEGYIGVRDVIDLLDRQEDYPAYYSEESRKRLMDLSSEIQDRMRVKISRQYINHALNVPEGAVKPHPVLKVVMPDADEVKDVAGETDPSNQNRYSPIPGLLHKYEMLLAYVSINCSSHCRYCYRSDLFSGISNKSKADLSMIAAYVRSYNLLIEAAAESEGVYDPVSGLTVHRTYDEPLLPIREILFSGGDPLTLPNATIARYLAMMAENGLRTIRFGTKEMVFNPERFNQDFWSMLDAFHVTYPDVRIELVGHYVHPFELVDAQIDEQGEYVYDINREYAIRADLKPALDAVNARRTWLGHLNQFPIIAGVNDRPDILRLLMYLTNRLGITLHNVYACREIIGNAHFRQDNTIDRQFRLLEMAKAGLSGIENHGRMIMSTEYGKVEVVGVEGQRVLLRLNRFVHGCKPENTLIDVDTTQLQSGKFYWLTQEVIDGPAISEVGKAVMRSLTQEDQTFIKQTKNRAAGLVLSSQEDETDQEHTNQYKVLIDVCNEHGIETIHVDLRQEKPGITLANVLARNGVVEAACGEKLSCSTCVGVLETSESLAEPSEDEMDLVDSALRLMPGGQHSNLNVRATCCLALKGGMHYRFEGLDTRDVRALNEEAHENMEIEA